MNTKPKQFKGGFRFKRFLGTPQAEVKALALPSRVVIPLKQGPGEEVPALVKCGDMVKRGQIIGRDDTIFSQPVHATISGIVEEIKSLEIHGHKHKAVVIQGKGGSEWQPLEGASANWEKLPPAKVEELVYLSGAGSGTAQGIPSSFNSAPVASESIRDVIVQHVATDVYNSSLEALFEEQGVTPLVIALNILKRLFPRTGVHLALDSGQSRWAGELSQPLLAGGFHLCRVSNRYPAHKDELLIPAVTGRPFPYGQTALEAGVLILDARTALDIYAAVTAGKPVIEGILPFSGPGFLENCHFKLTFGTLVSDATVPLLTGKFPVRLICDSPLTGHEITDRELPVTRACRQLVALYDNTEGQTMAFARPGFRKDSVSNSFLAKFLPLNKEADTNTHGEERACLSCGFCSDVCPTRLLPQLLHRYVVKGIIDEELLRFKIAHCIDCNLCTYVCTSKIDLAALIKKGKHTLQKEGYTLYPANEAEGGNNA